ncbi:hypothetical protein PHMEG_00012715 [Phytophthora megakarya]|uniref:Uncharacterized protein n=1 Tax=Phytophthora megakarya TaxID=4795 RepID=A0A225W9Q6_9STRA|nr:hypothetical protein PHMEG_00012715 [Phytophthora megakarya]
MREVILQKPFAAKYGGAGTVWVRIAQRVSTAINVVLIDKQVQDRVRLLKKNWRAGELRSALGSGIEESTEASDVQSHYETLAGLVAQYVGLESSFVAAKKRKKKAKEVEEASTNLCAAQIVAEATTRRALRGESLSSNDSSSESGDDNASVSSNPSGRSSTVTPTKPATGARRKSVFQSEIERQEKRIRADMEMRRDQFEQQIQLQQNQHSERLAFEKEQHASRLQFEREREQARERAEERILRARGEAEERNRELILQCVKLLGNTAVKKDSK